MRTIIIPVYNGQVSLEKSLKELVGWYEKSGGSYHFIFINDGSTDDSHRILQEFEARGDVPVTVVQYAENRGKGRAIQEGMKHVPPESVAVAFTDVDLPYGTTALEQGFELVESGIGFVYGSRTEAEKKQRQYSLYRKIGAHVFRLLLPKAVRKVTDTQSGLKVFSKTAADTIFPLVQTGQWVFDIELFLIAEAQGISFRELPVTLKASSITGRGGVRVLKHGIQILGDIIKIRLYALRGIYTKS